MARKKPNRNAANKGEAGAEKPTTKLIFDIPVPQFLPKTYRETIEALAQLRFPHDKKKRDAFIKNPGEVSLDSNELGALNWVRKLQNALAALDEIENVAKILSPTDATYKIGQQILQKIRLANHYHQKGNLAEFYSAYAEFQQLCNRANKLLLGPHAQRGKRVLEGAKKARPRKDPLDSLIAEILKNRGLDLPAIEALDHLRIYAGEKVGWEIDDNIYGNQPISYYDENDKLHQISYKTFLNRLTKVKQQIRKSNPT